MPLALRVGVCGYLPVHRARPSTKAPRIALCRGHRIVFFRNSQQHDRRLSHFQPLSASSLSATADSFKPRSVALGQKGNAFQFPRSPRRGGRSCSKTVVRASIPQTSLMRSKGQGRGRRKTTPSASLHPMRQIVHPSGHSTYLPLRNCPTNHATARGCVCPPRPCARPCFRSSSAALG